MTKEICFVLRDACCELDYDFYYDHSFKVELYGSWDNWTCGIKTELFSKEYVKPFGTKLGRFYRTKLNLLFGVYEYKWKVTKQSGLINWETRDFRPKINIREWNENNILRLIK